MIENAKKCNEEANKKTTKKWFNRECKAELEMRGELRLEILQKKTEEEMLQKNTEEARVKYEHQRRKVKRIIRENKRRFQESYFRE